MAKKPIKSAKVADAPVVEKSKPVAPAAKVEAAKVDAQFAKADAKAVIDPATRAAGLTF